MIATWRSEGRPPVGRGISKQQQVILETVRQLVAERKAKEKHYGFGPVGPPLGPYAYRPWIAPIAVARRIDRCELPPPELERLLLFPHHNRRVPPSLRSVQRAMASLARRGLLVRMEGAGPVLYGLTKAVRRHERALVAQAAWNESHPDLADDVAAAPPPV